jgi:hypothetical protein
VDPSQDYDGSGLCDAGAAKSVGCVFVSIDMLCTIGIVDGKRGIRNGIRNLTKGTFASYINPTRCSSRAKSPSQAKSSIWSST